MPIKEYQPSRLETIKAAIIDPSGRGKTFLAKTLNEPTILIAAEPGALCLRSEILSGQIKALEVNCKKDLNDVYAWAKDQSEYKHLYFDSITEISDIILRELEPQFKDGRQMYGEYGKVMLNIIRKFRDLPQYSVWFTALDSVEKDENNRRYYGPNVSGNMLKERFTSLFDLVIYYDLQTNTETGKEQRVLVTGNHKHLPGKDRSGRLDLFMPPDLSLVMDRILDRETKKAA